MDRFGDGEAVAAGPFGQSSSTALPVGASTSTSLRARCAAARSALREWVLPAPAGVLPAAVLGKMRFVRNAID